MDKALYLFSSTIKSLQAEEKCLLFDIRHTSYTGSSTRMMNPDRIDRYDNYWKVKKILSRARPLEIPSQMIKVESGHKVTLSDDGEEKVFHICSELDSIYCKSDSGISGRLLSLDSRLGKEIEGCSVGNKVKAGKVVKIESSEYL